MRIFFNIESCTSEEGFLTFQHLEVLFQSWWNVYLQRVVPSRKAFSRFDTWKFYFNLGETWASKEVFLLDCASEEVFILFAFQLWWSEIPKSGRYTSTPGEMCLREGFHRLEVTLSWLEGHDSSNLFCWVENFLFCGIWPIRGLLSSEELRLRRGLVPLMVALVVPLFTCLCLFSDPLFFLFKFSFPFLSQVACLIQGSVLHCQASSWERALASSLDVCLFKQSQFISKGSFLSKSLVVQLKYFLSRIWIRGLYDLKFVCWMMVRITRSYYAQVLFPLSAKI